MGFVNAMGAGLFGAAYTPLEPTRQETGQPFLDLRPPLVPDIALRGTGLDTTRVHTKAAQFDAHPVGPGL